jgi:ribosomal protein L23
MTANKGLEVFPVKTEKTYKLATEGVYTFAIMKNVSKDEIKKAIKDLYNVDVKTLTTLTRRSKKKTNWKVRKPYQTKSYKKVYVRLVDGQSLDFYK